MTDAEVKIYFSPGTGGFYDPVVSQEWPEDAVEITSAEREALIDGQAAGRHIVVQSGRPVLIDPAPPPHEQQRAAALAKVDAHHERFLVALTGGATVAERDTWKPKEEAARAHQAGAPTPGQSAMLAAEAAGAGVSVDALVSKIIAKADTFLILVGTAAGLRAKARAAIVAATDDNIPLPQVAQRVEAVFAALADEVRAAIAELGD